MKHIKVIAFDADDTLWVNEPLFQKAENRFCDMMEDFLSHHNISKELFVTQINNLPQYGYGVKGYILSMIETAINISDKRIGLDAIENILRFGKELLDEPVELIAGVEDVLQALQGHYRLVVATKGDLLDQERKLEKSGLMKYFHHTEIVSEKNEKEYRKLVQHLDIKAEEFLMIGNSLKSDILPVLNIGASAFHIPFHTTWAYEKIDKKIDHENFRQLQHVSELVPLLLDE